MANTIKTVMTYPLNGSTVDFNIPFEYLARKFVTITLIGTDRKVLVLNQDYRFSTKTTITLSKAWGPSDGYDTIEVRRYTSATDRLVDFADGSILRAYDLNIAQVQTLHVAEEARDLTADTIGVNNDGNLDARGRRIVNVADAVDDYDAINLHQVKVWNTSALNSANAAAASQAAAKSSENNSKASENAAKASQTDAASSMNGAHEWAQRAEDSPVLGSEFSAYHYSRKAAKSAAAASTSEGNAGVSERNSKTSETNAKTSETNAAGSAQTAKDEAAKLTNMNDLAAAINSVSGNDVNWKGSHWMKNLELSDGMPFIDFHFGASTADYTSRLIADGANNLTCSSDFSVNQGLTVGGSGTFKGNIVVAGTGRNVMARLHVNSAPNSVNNNQGLHLGWNETGSQGESDLINNQGGGSGGFVFRTVNNANNVERGRVTFSQEGHITAGGNIIGSDVVARGNVISNNALYAGGTSRAILSADGNVKGEQWGGDWLSNFLRNTANFTSSFGVSNRVRAWTGIGNGYLEVQIDGKAYAVGFSASDRRKKENIKVIREYEEIHNVFRSLIPVSYDFKKEAGGHHSRFGYLAQDIQRNWPEAVSTLSDGALSPNTNEMLGGIMLMLKSLDERLQKVEGKLTVFKD